MHTKGQASCSTDNPGLATRKSRGHRARLQGQSAENTVERAYLARGCSLLAKRLRIGPGEIDLVFRRGHLLVFVEVKSSATHHRASESLTERQLKRLMGAAECFRAERPELAELEMRIDLVTVDQSGRFRVIPNITL